MDFKSQAKGLCGVQGRTAVKTESGLRAPSLETLSAKPLKPKSLNPEHLMPLVKRHEGSKKKEHLNPKTLAPDP